MGDSDGPSNTVAGIVTDNSESGGESTVSVEADDDQYPVGSIDGGTRLRAGVDQPL